MSLLQFLILAICISSFFSYLLKAFQFYVSFQRTSVGFVNLVPTFSFYLLFLLLALDLICSSFFFFNFLNWRLWLLILDLPSFLIYSFNVINFPLWTVFATSHKLVCFHFYVVQNIFKFLFRFLLWSLIYLEVFCSISMYFEIFHLSFCYWLLINSIVVWEQTLYDFYFFFSDLVRCIYLLECGLSWLNVSCEFNRNVCSVIWWSSLYVSTVASWLTVVLSSAISL